MDESHLNDVQTTDGFKPCHSYVPGVRSNRPTTSGFARVQYLETQIGFIVLRDAHLVGIMSKRLGYFLLVVFFFLKI